MRKWLISFIFWSISASVAAETLTLLNWEDYIPEDILTTFETQTGHRISVKTYDSLEEAQKMLTSGEKFDLLVLSSHLVAENSTKLLALDWGKIPNIKNLDKQFVDPPYDRGNSVSLPYQWGTTGFGYHREKLGTEVTSWKALFEFDGEIDEKSSVQRSSI